MSTAIGVESRIAHVDVTDETITARLVDGRVISLPLAWSWRLSDATPAQRAKWQIIGDGDRVHWPDVDEDISADGMLSGALAEAPDDVCPIVGVVDGGPGILVHQSVFQGSIDQNGELARGGGDGLGLADPSGQTSIERTEGGVRAPETHHGHPENRGGTIGGRLGPGAEETATRYFVLRGQREPRGEVFLARATGPSRCQSPRAISARCRG